MEYESQQDRPFGPEDEEDINPYASPQTSFEPIELVDAESEVHGVWRDGDELVMVCHGAVVPKACCLTNRDENLEPWYYPLFGRRADWFAITILYWIPFSSVFVVLLSAIPARFPYLVPGNVAALNFWLHRKELYWSVWNTIATLGTFAYMISSVAAGCMLVVSNWTAVAGSYGVVVVGAVLVEIAERLKPVKPRAVDGFVRISGLHPDYLARLDDFTERVPNAPTT